MGSPRGRNGMPAGHPFQGSQPKHLEVINNKQYSLPRRPFLSQDSSKMSKPLGRKIEEKFDTEKMMRYDDFTDEDVGNIVMDAEPLEETKLQGLQMFHEKIIVAFKFSFNLSFQKMTYPGQLTFYIPSQYNLEENKAIKFVIQ